MSDLPSLLDGLPGERLDTDVEAAPVSTAGQRLGRYQLLYELAAGGMATLYLARVSGLAGFEKLVAIKRIHSHLARERLFVEMFLDEARIAARIHHPNVVQIYELGEDNRRLYIAMEYVEGESLARVARAILKQRRAAQAPPLMPLRESANIVAEAASGLHAAHELRDAEGKTLEVVHRDVSPHNILVTYDGFVKLIDFGVAKARGRISHTQGPQVKGKIAYMSPEQVQAKPVDRRSDIFSLGVVLYEMTCSRRLFKHDMEMESLTKIMKAEVPRPTQLRPDYPEALEQVVMKALARRPEDRFQTADEMRKGIVWAILQMGPPVGSDEIAALMRSAFQERIALKARLRSGSYREADSSDVAALLGQSDTLDFSAVTGKRDQSDPGGEADTALEKMSPRRPRTGLIAALVATLSALVTVAVLFLVVRPALVPGRGIIRVESAPAGALVSLDEGARTGTTPVAFTDMPLGSHRVEVQLDGYAPWEKHLTLERKGQEIVLDAALARAPASAPAHPAPPTVASTVPPAPAAAAATEPPRARDSKPTRRGGGRRATAPKEVGQLTLKTHPWSEVWLGKKKLGITPLVQQELPAGSHRLKLRPKGELPVQEITVTIEPGEHLRREVKLEGAQ